MIVASRPVLGDVVDALDAVHVAGGDRMQRRQVARVALGVEARADRGQHRVRAAEPARGADRDHRAVGDQRRRRLRPRRSSKCHRSEPLVVDAHRASGLRAASRTAIATASDFTPSSPVGRRAALRRGSRRRSSPSERA